MLFAGLMTNLMPANDENRNGGCGEAGRSRPFLPSPGNPKAEKDSAAAPLVRDDTVGPP
jgi:hypothetical protein